MKIGLFASALYPGDMSGRDAVGAALDIARAARRYGFDGVFVAEHHLLGPEEMCLPPWPLLGRLVAECPELHLGTSVHLGAMSHPVQTAENAAFMDVMTEGKFILGVGQGYRDLEFASLGIPKREKAPRLRESIAAMRVLFNDDPASFDGRFFSFGQVTLRPPPVRAGGPPVWVGSDRPETIARIPHYADAWIASGRQTRGFIRNAVGAYRAAFEELGRPYPGVPMFRELHIAETHEAATRRVGDIFRDMLGSYHRLGQPGERYDVDAAEAARDRLVIGAPDDVAADLASYRDEFQVPFMWFRVYWPGIELAHTLDTIQHLGETVLPRLKASE